MKKTNVYLIPGQGADYRLFNNFDLGDSFLLKHIEYNIPKKGMSLKDYAVELSKQIDYKSDFILVGTSMGGMLACEMMDFLTPKKVIIISSAKCRKELPARYKYQKYFPLYKVLPGVIGKIGAIILQPIVEPDRNVEKDTFVKMLKAKHPKFMKRSIKMVIEWNRKELNDTVYHIHGNNDNTLPLKNISANHIVKNGSHMMTLTRGKEISELILSLIEN